MRVNNSNNSAIQILSLLQNENKPLTFNEIITKLDESDTVLILGQGDTPRSFMRFLSVMKFVQKNNDQYEITENGKKELKLLQQGVSL